jgi:hypothetical protein
MEDAMDSFVIKNFFFSAPMLCLSMFVLLCFLFFHRCKKAEDAQDSTCFSTKKKGWFVHSRFSRGNGTAAFLLENDEAHFTFTDSWESEDWRSTEKGSSFSGRKFQAL